MVVLQLRWLSLGASRLSQMPGSNPPTTLGRVPQPLPASACLCLLVCNVGTVGPAWELLREQ